MYSNLILGNISNLECVCGFSSSNFQLIYFKLLLVLLLLLLDGDEEFFPTRVKVGARNTTRKVLFPGPGA